MVDQVGEDLPLLAQEDRVMTEDTHHRKEIMEVRALVAVVMAAVAAEPEQLENRALVGPRTERVVMV